MGPYWLTLFEGLTTFFRAWLQMVHSILLIPYILQTHNVRAMAPPKGWNRGGQDSYSDNKINRLASLPTAYDWTVQTRQI